MLDLTTEVIDVFTAAVPLAGLQIPLIASLPELYRRTKNPNYLTARVLSVSSSVAFLIVAVSTLLYLLVSSAVDGNYLLSVLFGALVAGVLLVMIALFYAAALIVEDADSSAKLEEPPKPRRVRGRRQNLPSGASAESKPAPADSSTAGVSR